MRHMFTELLPGSPLLWAPILSLILFIAVFAGVVVRVLRRPARMYDEVARLPLEGDRHE